MPLRWPPRRRPSPRRSQGRAHAQPSATLASAITCASSPYRPWREPTNRSIRACSVTNDKVFSILCYAGIQHDVRAEHLSLHLLGAGWCDCVPDATFRAWYGRHKHLGPQALSINRALAPSDRKDLDPTGKCSSSLKLGPHPGAVRCLSNCLICKQATLEGQIGAELPSPLLWARVLPQVACAGLTVAWRRRSRRRARRILRPRRARTPAPRRRLLRCRQGRRGPSLPRRTRPRRGRRARLSASRSAWLEGSSSASFSSSSGEQRAR